MSGFEDLATNNSFDSSENTSFPNDGATRDFNLTTTSTTKYDMFLEYDSWVEIVETISAVVFSPIGIIGNFLTIFTLTREKNRCSSTAIFVMALAASDNINLCTGTLCHWLSKVLGFSTTTDVGCKVLMFFNVYGIQTSAWLLAIISVERVMLVHKPLRAKLIFTQFSALIIVCIVNMSFVCLNVPSIVSSTGYPEIEACGTSAQFVQYYRDIFPLLDFIITFLIPFIILVISSSVIIVLLRKKLIGNMTPNIVSSVTLALLLVNMTFIVTMLPFCVYQLFFPLSFETDPIQLNEVWIMLLQLSELNAVLNFPLYCLGNRRFRQEVFSLLSKCKGKQSTEGVFGGKANRTVK